MLLSILGYLSPLAFYWVSGVGDGYKPSHQALTYFPQSCWAQPESRNGLKPFWVGGLFGTVPLCSSQEPFLLAVLQMACPSG